VVNNVSLLAGLRTRQTARLSVPLPSLLEEEEEEEEEEEDCKAFRAAAKPAGESSS
jgi:hypothetical protein